jgi:hypothetical protein
MLLLMLFAQLSCRATRSSNSPDTPTIAEALRFPHDKHSEQPCDNCHHVEHVLAGTTVRPGGNDVTSHESCAQSECHAAEFEAAKTRDKQSELCALCHEYIAPGESSLVPYPTPSGKQVMAVRFSHKQHLDADAMEEQLGFHLSCIDCHGEAQNQLSSELSMVRPRHAACGRCHAEEAAADHAPNLLQCSKCHSRESVRRGRKLIRGDLHFSHSRHRVDRKGLHISCSTCHAPSITATAEDVGNHASPLMRVCVDCHDDRERVPRLQRMRRCQTCHTTRAAGFDALAPRSHMPATERPIDHTQAFRRDHSADAKADAQSCARCHTMLSGNRHDTCDECHQVMRPRDHMITWREYDHGAESITEPDRCTTCHQVDFCVACHRSKPRSHFPTLSFRSGHGTQAILNMRACLTCHKPERDCTGSGCHQGMR